MKYRRLTKGEFEELHEEFIMFLSANTITGDDWKKIVSEDIETADKLMDMFSDIAFEKVLSSAKYVERVSEREVMSARFDDAEAEMIILRSTGESVIPANMPALEMKKALESKAFELIKGSKKYRLEREQEMFQLLMQNAIISDGTLFKQLKSLL
ncbi:DUF6495 family protein [Phaeocystidibacter marisrubri]|uniref:Uncharacterized protein n=1 Tax=Phaeocystidibacter marisrubri TaxID=1577780 RepID=A0A6L3ZL02_9FLAO|nr:DUF6495 family protein [Phaeocystidibacter marisrubri]KAB2818155.1 hypothetical protein F8C82_07060 [Phaeocystidibacter marisrubri]GGH71664.1 hypothetical protein GCM10011318_14860 [Phaeocystidibacter marisrubri]